MEKPQKDGDVAATQQQPALKILGQPPTPYEIITRQGVVDALWGILEESQQGDASDEDGTK